jgi:hypothetical protein
MYLFAADDHQKQQFRMTNNQNGGGQQQQKPLLQVNVDVNEVVYEAIALIHSIRTQVELVGLLDLMLCLYY